MEFARDFGDLVNGLQYLPEREKIILLSLIHTQCTAMNGDKAKLERMIGQMVIAVAREKTRVAHPEIKEDSGVVARLRDSQRG
jgi:hypothetical protein